jgi:hypothetical protein
MSICENISLDDHLLPNDALYGKSATIDDRTDALDYNPVSSVRCSIRHLLQALTSPAASANSLLAEKDMATL